LIVAGKYALYLPYKVIDSLSKGNVTDSQFREFILGLVEYDKSGIFPASPTAGFTMMFELLRPDLDFARTKYDDIVEKRREAGRQGGASKGNTNAAGNRGGGALLGNTNAAKKNAPDQSPEPENKLKHLVEFEPEKQTQAKQAKQAESESVVSYQNSVISGSGGVVSQPPETTTTIFINGCKSLGYSLEHAWAREVTAGMDPSWLSGAFTYPEYIWKPGRAVRD
jgi:hypothetical protein